MSGWIQAAMQQNTNTSNNLYNTVDVLRRYRVILPSDLLTYWKCNFINKRRWVLQVHTENQYHLLLLTNCIFIGKRRWVVLVLLKSYLWLNTWGTICTGKSFTWSQLSNMLINMSFIFLLRPASVHSTITYFLSYYFQYTVFP